MIGGTIFLGENLYETVKNAAVMTLTGGIYIGLRLTATSSSGQLMLAYTPGKQMGAPVGRLAVGAEVGSRTVWTDLVLTGRGLSTRTPGSGRLYLRGPAMIRPIQAGEAGSMIASRIAPYVNAIRALRAMQMMAGKPTTFNIALNNVKLSFFMPNCPVFKQLSFSLLFDKLSFSLPYVADSLHPESWKCQFWC